jgi:hypothetical protein
MGKAINGKLARCMLFVLVGAGFMVGGVERWVHGNGFDQMPQKIQSASPTSEVTLWPSILSVLIGLPFFMRGLWLMPHDNDR